MESESLQLFDVTDTLIQWHLIIRNVFDIVTVALTIAMEVVAEAPSDIPFSPLIGIGHEAYPSGSQIMEEGTLPVRMKTI